MIDAYGLGVVGAIFGFNFDFPHELFSAAMLGLNIPGCAILLIEGSPYVASSSQLSS